MNHDGEANEGNYCDADKYLMSAILGPGKVAWSDCSKNELEDFLDGRSSKSVDQVGQLTQFSLVFFVKKIDLPVGYDPYRVGYSALPFLPETPKSLTTWSKCSS